MRIAIIAGPHITVPPKKYGGTEKVIYYLIKGLQEVGHEIVLLAPRDSKVKCELVPIVDKAIYFARTKDEFPDFEKYVNKVNHHTEIILRKLLKGVDFIHSHGFDLINFQDFPNLTTLHSKIGLDDLQYYLRRKDLYYVSISKNQQGAFPQLQYIGVVYNGEDVSEFKFVKEPDDYVCFVGRFDREKSPHLAIQLAINLEIKIKLAGKIDHQGDGYFEEEVAKYFDHPLVEYLGELSPKKAVKLMAHAKCNLHPTGFREPFGLTVLEAAYGGTPTFAIARGSMPELIEEGRTGMLVEDFVEGYHQIKDCFKMDREYISNRARQLFNYKTMARQYEEAYERVIDIFRVRKQQREIVKDLVINAQNKLEDIWRLRQTQ